MFSLKALRPGLNSLFLRLVSGAALWSLITLVAAAIIIIALYRQTVESAFDERLSVYLKTLIGEFANQAPAPLFDPGNLGEQRFEQLFSGWYWQLRRGEDGPVVLASGSLFTETLEFPMQESGRNSGEQAGGAIEGPDGQSLRVVRQMVLFADESAAGGTQLFEVLMAGDAHVLGEEISAFANRVILTLGLFGLALVVSTVFQVRWGLRPLGGVQPALADIRSGREARFEGEFPSEIAPLARELNALLQSNKEIVERARTQVGNLAHALKTPLSVIANEARAGQGPLAEKVAEQAALMGSQITHYLDRARIAASVGVTGQATPVENSSARLLRAMEKIYGGRGIAIETNVPATACFRGEEQDLEEILGNLLDNACKWASSSVSLSGRHVPPADEEKPGLLVLIVEDDGPGLTPEECREATRRGKRLDESKPGSGLGLSIVSDLVGLYGGKFSLSRSSKGGLRAEVELPAA